MSIVNTVVKQYFPNKSINLDPKITEVKDGKIFEYDDLTIMIPNNVLDDPSRLEAYLTGIRFSYSQIDELEEKIKISDSLFEFLTNVNSKYSLQSKKYFIKEVLTILNEENIIHISQELEGLSEPDYSEKLSNIKYSLFKDLFK